MVKRKLNNRGFSLVEMMMATAIVVCISGASYRILKSATTTQLTSVSSQKTNGAAQLALARFKSDVSLIDYNWVRFGVAAVYPHQGYSFGSNYYSDTTLQQTEKLNDGVTFLRRDPSNDRVYSFIGLKRICYPVAQSSTLDIDIFDNNLKTNTVEGLAPNDWVLIYQAGHYVVAVVTSVGTSGFKLRELNDDEKQQTLLSDADKSTGFVTKAGVVMASLDYDGKATSSTDDDSYCFQTDTTRMQVLGSPVSYYVDYRTSNSKPKSSTNTYVLDSKGSKQKMLVRAEYVSGTVVREYLANVDSVGFTYDLLGEQNVNGSISDIVRDVGQDKDSSELLNLSSTNLTSGDDQFQSTYRIVALKMSLATISPNKNVANTDIKQINQIKIALDPAISDETYQDSTVVASSLTDPLTTLDNPMGVSLTEELGKPLYLVHGDTEEILVPVSKFQVNSDGSLGPESAGEIYVYDKNGCAANSASGCAPSTENSTIKFSAGTGSQFFPNTLVETASADGSHRILVGGVGVTNLGSGTVSRQSLLGVINLAPGETISQKLQSPVSGSVCNIEGCNLQIIDTSSTATESLVDTANISIDSKNADNIYVSTITKKVGESDPTPIYKGTWNNGAYSFTKWGDVPTSEDSRVVSAISSKTISLGNVTYVAACTSKKISTSCGDACLTAANGATPKKIGSFGINMTGTDQNLSGMTSTGGLGGTGSQTTTMGSGSGGTTTTTTTTAGQDEEDNYGSIMLLAKPAGESTLTSIVLSKNNYQCSSLEVDNTGNLIVMGRLTAQPISYSTMQRAVTDPIFQAGIAQQVMYLDEVATVDDTNAYFADYYEVDPTTYQDQSNPQFIGWMTGASMFEYPDGTFGMVNANKFRLAPGYGINTSSSAKEYSNAGISQISLAGMSDRVVASIVSDTQNLNNSVITATYALRSTDLPSVYIPGSFYVNSASPRTEPTPLPAISPSMSDASWVQMYQEFVSSHGSDGLNTEMPILGSNMAKTSDCSLSYPNTCK